MDKLILYGNGSMAEVQHYYLSRDTDLTIAGFTVDRNVIKKDTLFGLPVVPFDEVEEHFPPTEYKMMIAVGYLKMNRLRAEKYYQAKEMGYQFYSYISSSATVWSGLVLGENCSILDQSIISPFTRIGDNVFIGNGCFVSHHSTIKDHCFLSSRVTIAGNTTIEPYCFLGLNSTIRNDITVAKASLIGAGAVILGNTEEKGVYKAPAAERLPVDSDQLSFK